MEKIKGFKTHRHTNNPLEKLLHDNFIERHLSSFTRNGLDMMIFPPSPESGGTQPSDHLSEREKRIVISTIQWLGSAVGTNFLRESGFEFKFKKRKIALVAAMDRLGAIGKDNKLVHNIPEDMQRFINLTRGNTVIMGRKTYESIGKPLKNRNNIIISRNPDLKVEGCTVMHSVNEVLEKCIGNLYIIGGGEIYEQFLPYATHMHLTEIHTIFKGADCYFPNIDLDWMDYNTEYRDGYTFVDYKRED